MEAFARLLDQLYFTNGTRARERLLIDYLESTPDPDRGWAVAAIAGTLRFDLFKRSLIRERIRERVDPHLLELCLDYVGETSETVALLWPAPNHSDHAGPLPSLSELIQAFRERDRDRGALSEFLDSLLDRMTPPQRWALLKLGTRGLRIGLSERSVKKVLATYGDQPIDTIERLWHGVDPPYTELLAWLDGRADRPDVSHRLTFYPVMLSHPLEARDLDAIQPEEWQIEWKYDGIRIQWVVGQDDSALFSRSGENISTSFPDFFNAIGELSSFRNSVFDGELLVFNESGIARFNDLQQRLNKKKPSLKLQRSLPVGLMLYDVMRWQGEDLADRPLDARRDQLEQILEGHPQPCLHLSPCLQVRDRAELESLRDRANEVDSSVEGLMLKRRDSLYIAGRPRGLWFKWKREPLLIDAVMMYAQRGHGKRSSYYSDYTFGLWSGDRLLPVGKAYSGFTDEELKRLDQWVRRHTVARFGPVRELEKALVLEVAFDAVQSSKRHKSGVALRFPRINRIRWDKPAAEADRIETLRKLIASP